MRKRGRKIVEDWNRDSHVGDWPGDLKRDILPIVMYCILKLRTGEKRDDQEECWSM
jgi:hypothetical protein